MPESVASRALRASSAAFDASAALVRASFERLSASAAAAAMDDAIASAVVLPAAIAVWKATAAALSAAAKIRRKLNKLEMECSFGITTGDVYCGTVGSALRMEYAAIGSVVNMAARLMGKAHGGILIDDAIVVLESVFRCREEGDDHITAVVRGTSEVAMPVIASTFTTVAVFFPIVFVEGVAGQMFGDMALTVVFSQVASLIAALFLKRKG